MQAWLDWLKSLVLSIFWNTLAILFLIESWIWDDVKDWLRQLEIALGFERFEFWLADYVARLTPQMTLALFAVPTVAVLPFKFATVALFAKGYLVTGVVFVFLVKSLTLGVEAFLFDICRDKLLQMPWFAQFYSMVLDLRAWALALVRPLQARVMSKLRQLRDSALALLSTESGGLMRKIARLREAVRRKLRA
jgi:hypothetical protein